jgi:hypothetical protein
MKLLDFDLEIALKQPERVVYSDGEKPLDWKYFDKGTTTYLIVTIDKHGFFSFFTKTGVVNPYIPSKGNLKLLPETKTYWFCIYKLDDNLRSYTSELYDNKTSFLEKVRLYSSLKILKEYSYTEII